MDRILSFLPCCGPRRRTSPASNGQAHRSASEATPLLGAIHKSANNRDRSTQSIGSHSGSSASESQADAPHKPAAQQASKPAYTPQDLAYITSWAKSSFIDIREPSVLVSPDLIGRRRSSERLGASSSPAAKRRSIAEEVDVAVEQPAPEMVEQETHQRDAQVQNLVERLARAVAFDGWAMLPQES